MSRLVALGSFVILLVLGGCADQAEYLEGDLAAAVAFAEPHTTIRLGPGRYAGPLVIDRPLTIKGAPGSVIVGDPDSPTVTILRTEDVTISGVAIEGGESGVRIVGSEGIRLIEIEVVGAAWHGILAQDAEIDVSGCVVMDLRAPKPQGIEIMNSDSRPPSRVSGCRILGPVFEGIVAHVSHVTFENNEVIGSSPRGIVVTEMSSGRIVGNRVEGATGAAYFCGDQSVCSVVDNAADGVAAIEPEYRSGMGHGLVVHFNSVAHVESLQVDEAVGDDVIAILGSSVSAVPVDLGFGGPGFPIWQLLLASAALVVSLVGVRLTTVRGVAVTAPVSRAAVPSARTLLAGLGMLVIFTGAQYGLGSLTGVDEARGEMGLADVVVSGVEDPSQCFQGYCAEALPEGGTVERWVRFAVDYLVIVTPVLIAGVLLAGAVGALSARDRWAPQGVASRLAASRGDPLTQVSALTLGVVAVGSGVGAAWLVGAAVAVLAVMPLIARIEDGYWSLPAPVLVSQPTAPWRQAVAIRASGWVRRSLHTLLRIAPAMILVAFAAGWGVYRLSPESVDRVLGDHPVGVLLAASASFLVGLPMLLGTPVAAGLLLIGAATGPAVAFLVGLASGPGALRRLGDDVPRRAGLGFVTASWVVAVMAGLVVAGLAPT